MKKFFTMFAIAGLLMTTGCSKKGENDPFLSFKTRNARITGTWTLTSSESTSTNIWTSGGTTVTTSSSTTYDGNLLTNTSGGTSWSSTYSQEMTINKDGTYTMKTISDGDISEGSGYWWWLSDKKKKTRLALDDDWNSFDIDQLKNKEMIIKQDSWSKDTDTNGDVDEDTYTYTATFTKS